MQKDLLYIKITKYPTKHFAPKEQRRNLKPRHDGWLIKFINITLIILQYLSASLPGAMRIGVGISVSADQIN